MLHATYLGADVVHGAIRGIGVSTRGQYYLCLPLAPLSPLVEQHLG